MGFVSVKDTKPYQAYSNGLNRFIPNPGLRFRVSFGVINLYGYFALPRYGFMVSIVIYNIFTWVLFFVISLIYY